MIKKFLRMNRRYAEFLSRKYPKFFEEKKWGPELIEIVDEVIKEKNPALVLEVGGVDRPAAKKGSSYKYIGIDIDDRDACYRIYDNFINASIEQPLDLRNIDLVISKAVFEHVRDNDKAFKNLYNAMGDDSIMVHYIPSRFHPYALILRAIGPKWQRRVLALLVPGSTETAGYPAFFHHCDPSSMERLLRRTGFCDISFIYYYKATNYFAFFAPLWIVIAIFENICEMMQWRTCCSGMIVSARKRISNKDY